MRLRAHRRNLVLWSLAIQAMELHYHRFPGAGRY